VYWSVSWAPVLRVWGSTRRQVESARDTDVKALVDQPEPPPSETPTVNDQKFFRVVFQWWWMTPAANVPRAVGLFVALVLFALGAWLLRLSLSPPEAERR
jgi:hypothetical protein